MAIVIVRQDDKILLWKKALKQINPELQVYSFLEDHPINEIEVALVWKHPAGILSKYHNLKYIASSGAGVDFIFEDASVPKHLPITRVVDKMLANDMSEYIIAVIFNFLKNLNSYKLMQTKAIWSSKPYYRICDLKVGILGLGALGSVLAKDLVKFGFNTRGWSASQKNIDGIRSYAGKEQLSDFLAETQVLICLLPLTNKTKNILNKQLFKQLPKGAHIINAARGGHLVDAELIEMIDNGHLSGASLDVFHKEPLEPGHLFWAHEKINITPHCASVSDTDSVAPQIIENYYRMKKGLPLLYLVSKKEGY